MHPIASKNNIPCRRPSLHPDKVGLPTFYAIDKVAPTRVHEHDSIKVRAQTYSDDLRVGGIGRKAQAHGLSDYLGAPPGPQTGMGLPNGLRRRKFRSSEIPVFRIFDKIAQTRIFQEVF